MSVKLPYNCRNSSLVQFACYLHANCMQKGLNALHWVKLCKVKYGEHGISVFLYYYHCQSFNFILSKMVFSESCESGLWMEPK